MLVPIMTKQRISLCLVGLVSAYICVGRRGGGGELAEVEGVTSVAFNEAAGNC